MKAESSVHNLTALSESMTCTFDDRTKWVQTKSAEEKQRKEQMPGENKAKASKYGLAARLFSI